MKQQLTELDKYMMKVPVFRDYVTLGGDFCKVINNGWNRIENPCEDSLEKYYKIKRIERKINRTLDRVERYSLEQILTD